MATRKRATTSKKTTSAPATANRKNTNSIVGSSPLKNTRLLILIALLILVGLAVFFKNLFVVATVNNQPITRFAFNSEMEKEAGKKALNTLVIEALLNQEAAKKGIVVSNADIDAQMKQIETSVAGQGQTLDQLLAAQGMTRNDLTDQLRYQIIINKLLKDQAKVSDKEVEDYINTNKDLFPDGATDQAKTQAKQQLEQSKLSQATQTYLTNLQKSAKINYFVNY